MPKFLPWLPKPRQDRLEAMVERELTKWMRRAEVLTRRNDQESRKAGRTARPRSGSERIDEP